LREKNTAEIGEEETSNFNFTTSRKKRRVRQIEKKILNQREPWDWGGRTRRLWDH